MAIETFNRYEHKFLLDKKTYQKVLAVMDEHMELDSHNVDHKPYTIANIYYDTRDDRLIRHSLSKPKYKEKLRLRAYGVPDQDTKVFLEIKKKYNGLVNKRRTVLKLHEAYDFIETGDMPKPQPYMNGQILREISYFLQVYDLRPKVYLAYDRIAYFEKGNDDLRISFDMNIRTRREELFLEKGDFGKKLLEDGIYLMEIKTARAMPMWLTNMLTEFQIRRNHFSKYGTEFRQLVKAEVKMKVS